MREEADRVDERIALDAAFLRHTWVSIGEVFGVAPSEVGRLFDSAFCVLLALERRISQPWRFLVCAMHDAVKRKGLASGFVRSAADPALLGTGNQLPELPVSVSEKSRAAVAAILLEHANEKLVDESTRAALKEELAVDVLLLLSDLRRKATDLASIVRVLTARAYELCDSKPDFAIDLASVAIELAGKLPDRGAEGADRLLAHAWREKANALRFAGSLSDALRALEESAAVFERTMAPAYDLCVIRYIRASVLLNLERADDAAREVQNLHGAFDAFGDERLAIVTRSLAGHIEYLRGRYEEAATLYSELLDATNEGTDPDLTARLRINLANCRLESGDLDSAEKLLQMSRTHWAKIGAAEEFVAVWKLARITMRRGEFAAAIEQLHVAAAKLFDARRLHDVALVELDRADCLLSLRRGREVRALARSLISRFHSVGHNSGVLKAFGHLRQADLSTLTKDDIATVRRYVERVRVMPSLAFVPRARAKFAAGTI